MVYALVADGREAIPPRLASAALDIDGIELAMWRAGERGVIASRAGMLRFAPGGDVADERGKRVERRRPARRAGRGGRATACFTATSTPMRSRASGPP